MKNIKPLCKSVAAVALLFGGLAPGATRADEADQHKERGNIFHNAGRFDDALKEYRTAIRLRPHFPKAYNNIGSVYIDEGKDQLAIAPLLTAIKLDPKYAHAYYNLGKAYADTGKPEQAIVAYTRAAKLDPTDPDTLHNLGNIYVRAGQWNQAIPIYQKALHLGSPSPALQVDLANAYVLAGQDDQAIGLYQQVFAAEKTEPGYASGYYNFGCALSNKGRHPEAIAAFLRSIHLRPTDPRPHINLGVEYITMKQWDQAVGALREAVPLAPAWDAAMQKLHESGGSTAPQAHFNLGTALSGQGNEAEARTEWQKVLTLDHGTLAEAAKAKIAESSASK